MRKLYDKIRNILKIEFEINKVMDKIWNLTNKDQYKKAVKKARFYLRHGNSYSISRLLSNPRFSKWIMSKKMEKTFLLLKDKKPKKEIKPKKLAHYFCKKCITLSKCSYLKPLCYVCYSDKHIIEIADKDVQIYLEKVKEHLKKLREKIDITYYNKIKIILKKEGFDKEIIEDFIYNTIEIIRCSLIKSKKCNKNRKLQIPLSGRFKDMSVCEICKHCKDILKKNDMKGEFLL